MNVRCSIYKFQCCMLYLLGGLVSSHSKLLFVLLPYAFFLYCTALIAHLNTFVSLHLPICVFFRRFLLSNLYSMLHFLLLCKLNYMEDGLGFLNKVVRDFYVNFRFCIAFRRKHKCIRCSYQLFMVEHKTVKCLALLKWFQRQVPPLLSPE